MKKMNTMIAIALAMVSFGSAALAQNNGGKTIKTLVCKGKTMGAGYSLQIEMQSVDPEDSIRSCKLVSKSSGRDAKPVATAMRQVDQTIEAAEFSLGTGVTVTVTKYPLSAKLTIGKTNQKCQ